MISDVPFRRTVALLSSALLLVMSWAYFRFPHGNMLVATFAFLTSSLVVDVEGTANKIRLSLLMALYAAAAQFLVGITSEENLLRPLAAALFSFFTLATFPNRTGSCIILVVGYLACFAQGGTVPAVDRGIELFFTIFIILLVTFIAVHKGKTPAFSAPYSLSFSFLIASELLLGHITALLLQLKQGPWVMLTILFIYQSVQKASSPEFLARNRIFSVPLGIFLGGWYMSCFCYFDYRFTYIVPLIGALGFWILYNYGNYFLFSVIFMMTFTILADWQLGDYHSFYLWDFLFSRSFSTLLGVILVLGGEKFFIQEYKKA